MLDYLVVVRSIGDQFSWVLIHDGEELCSSPLYRTETKCVVEALFFGTVFGVEVILPEAPKPKRHLHLVTDED